MKNDRSLTEGKNIIIPEEKPKALKLFLNQFRSPLIYILLLAIFLTLYLGEYTDAVVILAAVILNTILGFYQEYKAENSLYHLRAMLKPKVIAIKDGKRIEILAEDIKVGEKIFLNSDYKVPADGVLSESEDILVNESMLTGESLSVKKLVGDQIYAGTQIVSGLGTMQVTAIGLDTNMGKIGSEVSAISEDQTPLQKQISALARSLTAIVLCATILLIFLGVYLEYQFEELLVTAISVAVASIPEGLVVTLTVILTLGMQRILRQKAVVRKLLATETLGAVTIICFDKTGTVTEGRLRVVESNFRNEEHAILSALLCNNLVDPIEVSMLEWVKSKKGQKFIDSVSTEHMYERLDTLPFNHKNKFTATLNQFQDKNIIFLFGAPESVIDVCGLSADKKKEINQEVESLSYNGNKLIGFAYKEVDKELTTLDGLKLSDLQWNGVMAFDDPVRKDVKSVIELCRSAGIGLKMITGDRLDTALSVAKQVGLVTPQVDKDSDVVITGEELQKLSEQEFVQRINEIAIFARTDPFQKLKIVSALKAQDEVVAMTGDGVNDAPALKKADIGIVVNEASEVSKGTADIVLLDSNLKTIVNAVEEGRVIFENIKKVILYLLSGSFSELVLIVGSMVLQLPLPVTAAQILWINLVEDSLPALSLAVEPKENDVMKQPPRSKKYSVLSRRMIFLISLYSAITSVLLLVIYLYLSDRVENLALLRTFIFVGLGIDSLWYIFSCKSLTHSVFQTDILSNRYMLGSVLLGIIMFFAAVYLPPLQSILGTVPLNLEHWIMLTLLGIANLLIIECIKAISNRVKF